MNEINGITGTTPAPLAFPRHALARFAAFRAKAKDVADLEQRAAIADDADNADDRWIDYDEAVDALLTLISQAELHGDLDAIEVLLGAK